MNRAEAWALVTEYTQSESLLVPETPMGKTQVAVALVRPTKSILDVGLKSVKTDATLDCAAFPRKYPNCLINPLEPPLNRPCTSSHR